MKRGDDRNETLDQMMAPFFGVKAQEAALQLKPEQVPLFQRTRLCACLGISIRRMTCLLSLIVPTFLF